MKNISIPVDYLMMLAELDDKEAGLMAKAIAQYASEGTAPIFGNGALKAIFSLFRSNIDVQRESSAKRSEINTCNAMSKKSVAKKKVVKKTAPLESELQPIASEGTPSEMACSEPLPLSAIETVYPKVGTYRDESLAVWETFSEEKKSKLWQVLSFVVLPLYRYRYEYRKKSDAGGQQDEHDSGTECRTSAQMG